MKGMKAMMVNPPNQDDEGLGKSLDEAIEDGDLPMNDELDPIAKIGR